MREAKVLFNLSIMCISRSDVVSSGASVYFSIFLCSRYTVLFSIPNKKDPMYMKEN